MTAVLVSHDGSRWLPGAVAALRAQTRPPQAVIGVDTGSTDGSAQLLIDTVGDDNVVVLDRNAGLADAIRAGLDVAARPRGRVERTEWVWVLHDDVEPAPDALLELLQEAERSPSATVLGPKQLAPDGRQLLEVGITVDSSGHRRDDVEPHELDQGQHDEVRDVLAVGTAAMLVRRDVWDRLGGLDPSLPLFGDDIDFGWRATAAGERVVVVPRATVRHAVALTSGARAADAVAGRVGAVRREHGMRVVLANTGSALVPLLLARYLVEAAVRAVALLLVRRPAAAYDEIAATLAVVGRPGAIAAARRRRAPLRVQRHREIRPLLPGAADRWRQLGDVVARQLGGRESVDGRQRRRAPVETGPVADEAQSLEPLRAGVLASLVRRPGFLLFAALAAVALVADRSVLGSSLHGGRLLPPSAGASDLWSTYVASWHPVGLGSTATAPPWLAALAVFATLLLGKVWLAVDLLVLGAVPLAGLAAYLAAGAVTRSKPVRVLAAVAYAFVPALTGAVSNGRLDVIVAVVLLPALARAVVGAARAVVDGRGGHRAVAAGLLLALVAAFAPVVWLLIAATALVGLPLVQHRGRAATAVGVVLLTAFVVLLPWSAHVLTHPRLLVEGAGLPEPTRAAHPLPVADVVLLHPGGPGQPPLWVWAPYLLAAWVGLIRTRRKVVANVGWAILAVGLAAVVVVSRLHGSVVGVPDSRYWTGVGTAFAALGALVAAAVAASGARTALSRHSFGWRQLASLLLVGAAVVATVVAATSWVVRGAAGPLSAERPTVLPVFAAAALAAPTTPRALVLRTDGHTVRYALVRSADEPALGAADVGASPSGAEAELTDAVRAAVAGLPAAAPRLAQFGIGLVVAPTGDASHLAGLDAVDGLTRVPTSGAVVWRVAAPAGELAVHHGTAATVLPARAGSADVSLPGGSSGGRLVLLEHRDPGWTATLDGRRLRSVHAGWAQAWSLPAGGGRLSVRYVDTDRHAWLVVEAVLLAVALLACVPSQRKRREVRGA